MFVVSTIRGINIVFNDVHDLENHVTNLTNYLNYYKEVRETKTPVYGCYPDDLPQEIGSLITRSLQNCFTIEPEPPTEEDLACVDKV